MLESITSSVQRKLVESPYIKIIFLVMILYIGQLCYLAYTDQINISMIIIEVVVFFKLVLMYIYKRNNDVNQNNEFSGGFPSSESLPEVQQETENPVERPPNEPIS